MLFVKGLTSDFDEQCKQCVLYVDNQSAIKMIMNSENTRYSKHIDIKFHFVKDIVNKNIVKVKYVSTTENNADILTKALCNVKFSYFRNNLHVI